MRFHQFHFELFSNSSIFPNCIQFSPAARGGNLAKIPPNQVIADFGRGSSVESESEWCPAGIIERVELFKMASNMATLY